MRQYNTSGEHEIPIMTAPMKPPRIDIAAPPHLLEDLPREPLEERLTGRQVIPEPDNVLGIPLKGFLPHELLGLRLGAGEVLPDGAEELCELFKSDGSRPIRVSLKVAGGVR